MAVGRVLVTGASAAAGEGVLAAFLDAGWAVAGTTRREPPDEPAGVHWIRADLDSADAAQAAVRDAVNALSGLDALVCLTGGFAMTAVDDLSWDDFTEQLGTGLRPVVEAALAALPAMRAAGAGSIVTIGAQASTKPGPRVAPWAVAKSGVLAFSQSLAAAGRPLGVRVNCVLPGTIDTPANRASRPDAKRDAWVTPRQLGELIVFLCSPASAPLTGAAIPIG